MDTLPKFPNAALNCC